MHTLEGPFSALTGPFVLIFGEVSGPGGGKRILVSKRVFSYVDLSNPVWGQAEFRILPSRILASSHHHNFIQRPRWIGKLYVFGKYASRALQKV